jgi:hypothetical protein
MLGGHPYPGAPNPQRGLDIARATLAGGHVAAQMLHPSTAPFERVYRKLPLGGMFSSTTSPSRPFEVSLGAFRVPPNMVLAIFNVGGGIYQPSGVAAGDVVPAASQSLSTAMGYSITIDGQTPANLEYQLQPSPVVLTATPGYPGGEGLTNTVVTPYGTLTVPFEEANQGQFAQAFADSYAGAAGPGISTQPQREERFGAPDIPFTLYADPGQLVEAKAIIFRPLTIPVAFIQYKIQGLLMPVNPLREILNSVKYAQSNEEAIR